MKKSHLQSFTVQVKTMAPLFIGSGREVNKKEYVYVPAGQKVCIIDFPRFAGFLTAKGLEDQYTSFMLGEQNDLYRWLLSCRITQEEIKSFTSYEVMAGDALKSGYALRGIHLFIKDNYGRPYLPGSSLKGALRTAILAKMLADQGDKSLTKLKKWEKSLRESNRYNIAGETDQLEVELLHTLNLHDERQNAVNSVMRDCR